MKALRGAHREAFSTRPAMKGQIRTARTLLMLLSILLGPSLTASAEKPRIVRENTEWLDVWVPNTNARDLPCVLLIGDSIVKGYGPLVEQNLKGTAYVARLATSKSVGDPALLAEIALVIGQSRFDVIHFNNGLHGWGYSEEEYGQHFPALVETLKTQAKGAKLIWATTTPVRNGADLKAFGERTERVKARNRIAATWVEKQGLAVDDLFALVVDHPEYYREDGTHFNAKGIAAQAERVAQMIRDALR